MRLHLAALSIGDRTADALRGVACAAVLATAAEAQVPSVGSDIGNPAVFGRLFHSVCVASPTLAQAQEILDRARMLANPDTGTFFHQQFDMSVNPSGELCSIVFSAEDEDAATDAFRQSVARVDAAAADSIEIIRLAEVEAIYLRAAIGGRWP